MITPSKTIQARAIKAYRKFREGANGPQRASWIPEEIVKRAMKAPLEMISNEDLAAVLREDGSSLIWLREAEIREALARCLKQFSP